MEKLAETVAAALELLDDNEDFDYYRESSLAFPEAEYTAAVRALRNLRDALTR